MCGRSVSEGANQADRTYPAYPIGGIHQILIGNSTQT